MTLPVPRGLRGLPHHLAALALFLGTLEAITGALLSAHYLPTPREAHASVRAIVAEVPFGELLRALHLRGAELLVVTAWLLVLSLALAGGHRRARALGWCAALGLAFATIYESLLGSLLPWSLDAAASARMATESVSTLPVVGAWMRRAMLGGDAHGPVTLVRVWATHATLLPGAASVLFLLLAMDLRGEARAEDELPWSPHFVTRVAALCTATSILLLIASAAMPASVGAPASASVRGGAPPWYLGAVHLALKSLPARMIGVPGASVAVLGGAGLALVLAALPWLDREGGRVGRAFVALLALALLGGTVYARLR